MMTVEQFDNLLLSTDKGDNATANFIGTLTFVLGNWEKGNACHLYDFLWDNVLIMSEAHKQEAIALSEE